MHKSPEFRQPSFLIRQLEEQDLQKALDLFGQAVSHTWPLSAEEASNLIRDEFQHPETIVYGAMEQDNLIGVSAITPMEFVFNRLPKHEQDLLLAAIEKLAGHSDLKGVIHAGGLAVTQEKEGRGVVQQLAAKTEEWALQHNKEMIMGHTARPNDKYPKIGAMPIMRNLGQELPLDEKIYYPSLPDIEKVWLYKLYK